MKGLGKDATAVVLEKKAGVSRERRVRMGCSRESVGVGGGKADKTQRIVGSKEGGRHGMELWRSWVKPPAQGLD